MGRDALNFLSAIECDYLSPGLLCSTPLGFFNLVKVIRRASFFEIADSQMAKRQDCGFWLESGV